MTILMFNADICWKPVCFQLVCRSLNFSLLISETDPFYSELVYKSLYWVTYSFLGKIKFFKRSHLQRHFFEVVFTHASFSQGKTKMSTDVFSPLCLRLSKSPIFVPCCAFSLKLASLACPHCSSLRSLLKKQVYLSLRKWQPSPQAFSRVVRAKSLSVTSQLTVESRIDRAENAYGLGCKNGLFCID